jgi:hypothetical protein
VTITKKGSRPIIVEGLALRYSIFRNGIQGCPDCGALHVIILDDSRRGSAVRICIDPPWGPDQPITPRMIAAAASRALARGWQPGEGTGVFLTVPVAELPPAPPLTGRV